jgi:hypothetical protein
MRVFCPTCGSQNDGAPGTKVTCQACAAAFDVPRESAPPVVAARVPEPLPGPSRPAPLVAPPRPGQAGRYNTAAIISLVCGVLSCLPLMGLAAVISGVIALRQLNSGVGPPLGKNLAIAGVSLGGLMLAVTALLMIAAVFN